MTPGSKGDWLDFRLGKPPQTPRTSQTRHRTMDRPSR
nr:MAG TPA: hypothetical protein [Caudoviricetes sp.]